MNTTFSTTKTKIILILAMLVITIPSFALSNDLEKDTVIIKLNDDSKIMIITKSQKDLENLKNYDINQIVRDLNSQLSDTIKFLEINNGEVYLNNENVSSSIDMIDDHEVKIKLGGIEIIIDDHEREDYYDDEKIDIKKEVYQEDRIVKTTYHFNIDIGLNNWLESGEFPDANNSPYSIKPFGSWYVALNSVNRTLITKSFFLEWGLGVSWYNWKLEDVNFKIEEGDDRIEFNRASSNINGEKSKLTATYVNVMLVPMFDFSKGTKKVTKYNSNGFSLKRYSRKGFRFGIGGYAGYRIDSYTKFKFNENGSTEKNRNRDNFYLENFRYGLRAQVGWKGVEFFANYDLNNVFSSNKGPLNDDGQNATLNALSFGITL